MHSLAITLRNLFICFMLSIMTSPHPAHAGYAFDELESYLHPEEKTISMDFTEAELSAVLKIFSQQSGLNFIASAEIESETVSLFLDNVPVEEALERILSANNFTYDIKPGSNIFVVKKASEEMIQFMTRVYYLKHIPLPSSKLYATLTEFGEIEGEVIEETELGIIQAVTSLLSENGSVIEDRRTNSLIIKDLPSRFPMIEQTIARLDIRIPLIMIEAEMLDVAKNKSDLLGAKFGDTPAQFFGASKLKTFPFKIDNAVFVDANQGTAGELSYEGLTLMLQFLRTQTDTKNLARPRILTLNNQTAQISIETDEAIGILNTTSGADAGTQNVVQAERTETGIFLTVTPSANIDTGEITMAVEPKVIGTSNSTVEGQSFRDPEERGSKSILRVRDGDTIVLGGLLSTSKQNITTRVPFVSKIPILGSAFRHKNIEEEERELLIFLTPQIVKDFEPQNTSVYSSNRTFYREQNLASQDQINQQNTEFPYHHSTR